MREIELEIVSSYYNRFCSGPRYLIDKLFESAHNQCEDVVKNNFNQEPPYLSELHDHFRAMNDTRRLWEI